MRHLIRGLISLSIVFILVTLVYRAITTKSPFHCANTASCQESFQLKIENNAVGLFNKRQVVAPNIYLAQEKKRPSVLGSKTALGEKRIYVDLTKQTLYAFQGNNLVLQTFIASGKWYPTPTGEFSIWSKLRSTRMSGGSGDDYYNLPNVPYVMFFANNQVGQSLGFSLHGTYWHNNFGHPMSHGCVNMRIIDAEKIYNWADSQTKITIYGQAPI